MLKQALISIQHGLKFTENFQHHLIQVTQFPSLLCQCSHTTNNVYSNKGRDNPQKFNEINQNGRLKSQKLNSLPYRQKNLQGNSQY